MKNLFKMMKKGDILIIGLLVILSFLPLAYFSSQNKTDDADSEPVDYAVIKVDGEEIHRMELKDDGEIESYLYENDEGHMNLVERDGTVVYMAEANCADSLCLRQGEISKNGEMIVCLPHRVFVEIETVGGTEEAEEENDVDFVSMRN